MCGLRGKINKIKNKFWIDNQNKFLFKNDVQLKDIYTQDPSIKLMIDDIQNQINEVSKEINSLSGKNN